MKKLPTPIERDAEDARLLLQVIDYYHETLLASPEALDYLKRRGIGSEEAIKTFKLGYANRTLGYRLPQKNRVEGAAMRGQLQRIGLLRESGHEHFNGSIVIPVIHPSGEVTEVYGRKINDNLREGHAAAPVSAGAASRRVERGGTGSLQGNHPVRGPHRCADLLVCGVSQRHGQLTVSRVLPPITWRRSNPAASSGC